MSQISRWTWRPLVAGASTMAAGGAARWLRWRGKRAPRPCDVRAELDSRMLEPRRLLDAGLAGAAVQALSADYVQVASSFADEASPAASEGTANTPPSNVVALPNPAIDEGGEIWLRLAFADPDADDRHQVQVSWGDGASATYDVEPGSRYFSTLHRYADDDPSGTSVDTYVIAVSVVDQAGGTATGTSSATVRNVAPHNLMLSSLEHVQEGALATLEIAFDDPGLADQHSYQIDWGDGTTSMGAVVGRNLQVDHVFADDGLYTVTVSVWDDDGGVGLATTRIEVTNVDPDLTGADAPFTIAEGQLFDLRNLGVGLSDPGFDNPLNTLDPSNGGETSETFTGYDIVWGDGTAPVALHIVDRVSGGPGSPTVAQFAHAAHAYVDDGRYVAMLTLADDDGAPVRRQVVFDVVNVAPHNLQIAPMAPVFEGEAATLQLSFDDPGLSDVHTIDVAWGDGTFETFVLETGARQFAATHAYVDDDPSGTAADQYVVSVVIRDDDGGTTTGSTAVTVRNVAPHDVQIASLEPASEGDVVRLNATFLDPGLADKHSYQIDWGDGRTSTGAVVGRTVLSEHVYADNGLYTVTLVIRDDDGGVGRATTRVEVTNVDPQLTGADLPFTIFEGQFVTLGALGVGLTDPGFDNPLNTLDPSNGGETSETFTGYTIDWGDGTAPVALHVVDRVSGGPGAPTVAQFAHAAHAYADDGRYVATLTLADDDGAPVRRQVVFDVVNVAPTLTLTPNLYRVDEGTLLELPDLGAFSDPGFDNPLNPLPGGEVAETFVYSIDWGDGTPVETGLLPATRVSGGPGAPTTGTLARSHFYADNDRDGVRDNLYTVTVTLADDDGGVTVQTFLVGVWNTDPVLEPVSATDVDARGTTTLTLEFADRGADSFEVLVDWGDRLSEPDLEARFVVATAYAGPTPQTFVLTHTYAGPPDPLNPAADIEIRVKVRDDDFGFAGMQSPGESNLQRVAISNPGTGTTPVRIDTTPQVPRLTFPVRSEAATLAAAPTFAKEAIDSGGEGGAAGETQSASERYLEIRIVYPDGTQSAGFRVNNQALQDLPGLFRELPDNRYAIYLVQPETGLRRLVLEAYVRQGRLVDSSEEADDQGERLPGEGAAVRPGAEAPAVEDGAQGTAEGADEGADALPAPAVVPAPGADAAPLLLDEAAAAGALPGDLAPGSRGPGRHADWHWAAWALVGTAAERRVAAERALAASTPADWRRWRRRRRPPITHHAG